MKVHIKYYAKYVEYTGRKEEEIEIDSMTALDLLSLLRDKYPKMSNDKSPLIAVNNKFGSENKMLEDGFKVSIFPPASGG